MKSIQLTAAVSLLVVCCAWRFADDEVTGSEQFLATAGDQKTAGRLRATNDGVVFELFANDDKETTRASLALDQRGVAGLTLRDGKGHARFHVTTDDEGATSLGITDGHGQTVWGIDVDARGQVKIKSRVVLTPTEKR